MLASVFAGAFFLIFTISERVNRSKHALAEQHMKEHFQLLQSDTVERAGLGIRAGNVMVTVRDYNTLNHLKWVLERIDTKEQDIVVMSARVSQFGAAAYDLSTEQIFSDYEQQLFTRAVSVAENFGKHVSLLVVPARDPLVGDRANRQQSGVLRRGLGTFQQDERPGTGLLPGTCLGGHARAQAAIHFPGHLSQSARLTPSASGRTRRR